MNRLAELILKFLRLDSFIQLLGKYIDVKIDLLKSEIKHEIVQVLVKAGMMFMILIVSLVLLLFLSLGMVNFINDRLNNGFAGYWIVAGFYAILVLVMILFREKLTNYLLRVILKNKKD